MDSGYEEVRLHVLKLKYWRTSCLTWVVYGCRGICLLAPSINPHFPGLHRFNSHHTAINQYELSTHRCPHLHTLIRIAWDTHTHTHIKETQLVATLMWRNTHIHTNLTLFQSMRDPLWFLLGGLPSSHEFRNLVCQLAVRTRQVSPQHKSVSQGPINKHSRRTQGQINSETMYLPCSGCKIFLNTYKLAWSLLMAVHSHAPPLQRRWSDTPWAANVFSKSHYVSRNTCLKLQLLSPGICLGVIAVRSFKSTRRKSNAFYRTSPHQSVNHLFIRSAGSISKLKVSVYLLWKESHRAKSATCLWFRMSDMYAKVAGWSVTGLWVALSEGTWTQHMWLLSWC